MPRKNEVERSVRAFADGMRAAQKLKERLDKEYDSNEKAIELENVLQGLVDVPLFREALEILEWRLRGFSHGFVKLSLQKSIKFSKAPWASDI